VHRDTDADGAIAVDALIAGWVAGYTMAILSTLALTYLAFAWGGTGRGVRRWWPGDVSPLLIAVPASLGTTVAWTMVGLALASFYRVAGLGSGPGFLGAPSAAFLAAVAGLGATPLPILWLLWPRHWWVWCGMSAAFVLLFGWSMPLLAGR
jgi:hypothetical protein